MAEVTLHRWLKQEGFQAVYREARRQVVQQAITQVQRASTEAVGALLTIMQDSTSPASARVSAAKVILEIAFNGLALEDLDERLSALEERGHP